MISRTDQLMMQHNIKERLVPIGLFRIILAMLMLLIFAHKSFSQTTRYWTGATDNNWSNTGNWSNSPGGGSCGCTPGTMDPVIFNSTGNVNCLVNVGGGVTVGGVTVNSGYTGSITLSNSIMTTGVNIFSTGSITGSSSLILSSATSTAFGGTSLDVTVSGTTSSIVFNGSVFTKSVTITKTGATTDVSSGGNTFGAAVSLTNSGSGDIKLESSSGDTFNSSLALNNSGAGSIYVANNGTTNFNSNISLSNSPGASAKGIYFSNSGGTGSSIQTAGTLALGGSFSGGELRIRGFSQAAANTNPISLTLTGNSILYLGDNLGGTSGCNFWGNVTFKAPGIVLDKSVYNGAAYFEKTVSSGTSTIDVGVGQCTFNSTATFVNSSGASGGPFRSNGGNTFVGAVSITNSSTQDIALEYTTGSTYNSTVTYNNSNGNIYAAYLGATFYGDNITISNTGTSTTNGISFGKSGGTATLAGSIIVMPNSFDSGTLLIQSLTQTSGGTSTITLTSASSLTPSTLQVGPGNTFVSDVSFKAPQLLLSGGHYNGNNSSFEKTGGTTSDLGAGNNFFGDAATDVITITNSATTSVDLRTNGGNTFNGTTTINNTGTGDISLEYGSGSTYNAPLTLTNNPTSGANVNIQVGFSGTTIINANIILNSTGSGGTSHGVFFGDESSSGGAGSVTLSNSYSMSLGSIGFNAGQLRFVRFTQNGTTSQSLALTAFSATVSAGFKLGPYSTFNGNVSFSAPSIILDGCTYNGTATITKNTSLTTAVNDLGRGGNTFASITTISNSSNGILATAAVAAASGGLPDTFNGALNLNTSSSGVIRLADKVNSTVFNDNITCNSTGSGGGIYIGYNSTTSTSGGTSSLLEGKTISGTSSNGTIQLANFTQGNTVGSTLQQILSTSFTGSAILALGPGSTFYGNVDFSSPGIVLNGCTYKGTALLTKTGSSIDLGAGGNTFEKTVTLANSGSGELRTANGTNDIFKDDLTTNNTGGGSISLAYNNSTFTQFQKNVIFNSTNSASASGVYIGVGGGVGATLASGSKLLTGNDPLVSPAGSGVSGGKVYLGKLQQPVGVTDTQSMTFTQNGNNALLHISNSYFRGDINSFAAPRILLDGNTFAGANKFVKTGTVGDDCGGGNTFTGATTLATTSSVSSYWAFSNSGSKLPDTFNGPVIIDNQGSNAATANINLAHSVSGSTATAFNSTVTFKIGNANPFITVGNASGAGATFSGQITMSSVNGTVVLGKSDISGTQNITSTTGKLIIGSSSTLKCHFTGDLSVQQNQVTVQYSAFDGNTTIEKTGGNTDTSSGSNSFGDSSTDAIQIKNSGAGTFTLGGDTFNGTTIASNTNTGTLSFPGADTFNASTTFTNSSTGTLSLSGTDTYNSSTSFNNTSTGTLSPANTGTSTFYGDISTNSSSAIIFGNGGGNVTFAGGSNQSISKTLSTSSPKFTAINLSKTAGSITLNTDIAISTTASVTAPFVFFTKASVGGIINSTSTNIIKFDDNAAVQGTVSNTSHINGPVQKTGNDAFIFPTGNNGVYRAITISAPSSTSDVFAAQYYKSSPISAIGSSKVAALTGISDCEYWLLNHTAGTSAVSVTLSWTSSDCVDYSVTDISKLSVAQWDGANWTDLGSPNGGTTGTAGSGTVASKTSVSNFGNSLASVTNYAPFTIATTNGVNALPIELSSFSAQKVSPDKVRLVWRTDSEVNNMGFELQKSSDGTEFYKLGFIEGHGTTAVAQEYTFEDGHPSLKNYYRLKQIDFDGKYVLTTVRFVQTNSEQIDLAVFPNPFSNVNPGKIMIEGRNPEIEIQLDIINSSGIHLKSYFGNLEDINTKFVIDIQSLEAGLYFVRALLEDTNKVLINKIIKN